jgi:hypothetical protein
LFGSEPTDSLDALSNIEPSIEPSVIAFGVSDDEFTLLLYQEIWSAGVVAKLERADNERLVPQELIATLSVLSEIT